MLTVSAEQSRALAEPELLAALEVGVSGVIQLHNQPEARGKKEGQSHRPLCQS